MKQINSYYTKLEAMKYAIEEYIEGLEVKRDAIENRAIEKDRDMTEKEQTRYDALDGQIDSLNAFISNIESAMYDLEEYWTFANESLH